MSEFNVGDKVWWASCDSREIPVECPVCFGKKVVIVILGNEMQVQIECQFCDRGFSGAIGYVEEYKRVPDVRQVPITHKEINEYNGKRIVEYRYESYVLDNTNAFETKEEAEVRCLELIAEREQEDNERRLRCADHKTRTLSWHIGYHQREAKRAKEEFERHSARVVALKNRVLPPKDQHSHLSIDKEVYEKKN